jgi:hypothetical protein
VSDQARLDRRLERLERLLALYDPQPNLETVSDDELLDRVALVSARLRDHLAADHLRYDGAPDEDEDSVPLPTGYGPPTIYDVMTHREVGDRLAELRAHLAQQRWERWEVERARQRAAASPARLESAEGSEGREGPGTGDAPHRGTEACGGEGEGDGS